MKFELDLIRGEATPLPEGVAKFRPPTEPMRKELRELTDFLVDEALRKGSMVGIANGAAHLMIAVAQIVDKYDVEPDVHDMIDAAVRMIQVAHNSIDRGLMVPNWDEVKAGCVMMELTVRGVCAALGIPYDEVLKAAWSVGDCTQVLVQFGKVRGEAHEQEGSTDQASGGDSGEAGID